MDKSDEATEYEERQRKEAVTRRKETITACGWCHNCTEPLRSGEIFCSKDCSEDWQKRQDMRIRNGV